MPLYAVTYSVQTIVFAKDPPTARQLAADCAHVEVSTAPAITVSNVETWKPHMPLPPGWLPEDPPIGASDTVRVLMP